MMSSTREGEADGGVWGERERKGGLFPDARDARCEGKDVPGWTRPERHARRWISLEPRCSQSRPLRRSRSSSPLAGSVSWEPCCSALVISRARTERSECYY